MGDNAAGAGARSLARRICRRREGATVRGDKDFLDWGKAGDFLRRIGEQIGNERGGAKNGSEPDEAAVWRIAALGNRANCIEARGNRRRVAGVAGGADELRPGYERSEEHKSELQSR